MESSPDREPFSNNNPILTPTPSCDLIRAISGRGPNFNKKQLMVDFQMTTRAVRRQRTLALFAEPEFLDDLLEEIAEGSTLLEISEKHDIKYGQLYQWLQSDEDRLQAYDIAEEARNKGMSDRVLSGVLNVTRVNVKHLLNGDGTAKDVTELTDKTADAIAGIDLAYDEHGRVSTRRYKQHDKLRALEMLGRNQRMFTDRVDLGGSVTLESLVAQSMKKTPPDVPST